ncbi:hypothetical protein BH09BAC5_BH09BAC5_02880 [soil metagenome]
MKKTLLSAITLFAFSYGIIAQSPVRCYSAEYMQEQIALNPSLQQSVDAENQAADQFAIDHPNGYQNRAVVVIPVVFHVVYKTASQNISNSRLMDQLDVINADYRKLNTDANLVPSAWTSIAADCEIQFCLAQRDNNGNFTDGIERISTTTTSWSKNDNVKHVASGGADAWNRSKYLNIWVCNLSGGILGYSTFPGGPAALDGVVLSYQYVGTTGTSAPYNKGRTATHEIGHWLNLKHIWGDDGSACTGSDNVTDTPNQSSENYGCPSFPHTDACTTTSPGVMWMDYMDYTDDACMYMFTAGQKTRMWSTLNGSRIAIKTSNGCLPVGIAAISLQNIFAISPNPTNGSFKLKFGYNMPDHFDVTVYNLIGEKVFTQHYDALTASELNLDLSGNNPGVYMIEVSTLTGIGSRKIVLTN